MIIFLTILSIIAVLILFGALAYFLIQIFTTLESIGGNPHAYNKSMSYLGKIAFGVRAIEQETGHLGPQVTRLNQSLGRAAEGLMSIDNHLTQTITAVQRQEQEG